MSCYVDHVTVLFMNMNMREYY